MLASNIIAPLAAFAGLATASPLFQRDNYFDAIPADWTWQVANWTAGCSRLTCTYNFNVTIPSVPGKILGVKAYCSGTAAADSAPPVPENDFENCQILEGVNNGVSAKFGPLDGLGDGKGPEKIFVSFRLAPYVPDHRPAYNFTGSADAIYNAGVAPLANFNITPTEVFAVA